MGERPKRAPRERLDAALCHAARYARIANERPDEAGLAVTVAAKLEKLRVALDAVEIGERGTFGSRAGVIFYGGGALASLLAVSPPTDGAAGATGTEGEDG